jgi:uncharacterized protein (TIGR02145 family)
MKKSGLIIILLSIAILAGIPSCKKKEDSVGAIVGLICTSATNSGTLTSGTAASGVSSSVPYTGGNGGTHNGQTVTSTGVTGLTATLVAGSFASGSGSLTYTISGTPANSGTANFALSIGGQTCTLSRTVNVGSCGATNVHNPVLTYGSMTDQDGNVYKTIVIGTQEWMAENLRARTYRNGVAIPLVTDQTQWAANWNIGNPLQQPMMCWYNNDSATYACPYGRLYNWYAVTSSNNVCPTGWHVPSDVEWTTLTDFLGGENVAGGKMKSTGTQYWYSPNTAADNSSGFSGLPGGVRNNNGTFGGIGVGGFWWSSTENLSNIAWGRQLDYASGYALRSTYAKANGYSVRCLRD